MSIEQKAREIGDHVFNESRGIVARKADLNEAARLGIIEGRRQAFEEAAKVAEQRAITQRARAKPDDWPEDAWNARQIGIISHLEQAATAIRALIEEQRPLGVEFEAVWDANTERLYEP